MTQSSCSYTAKALESNSPEKKLENPTSSLLQAFVGSCPRHAELAVAELGLQAARPQTRPGCAKPKALLTNNWSPMCRRRVTGCQQDWHASCHTDLVSRSLAKNTAAQSGKQHKQTSHLKRIGRYLLHAPRALWELPAPNEEGIVTVEGLSVGDAVGCPKTPRSTSEGSLRIGPDTLVTWSSTQKVAALSSAESEYHSMVRCASEAIGLANTIRELGHEVHEQIWTGALGARGMALRSGSGAIKHMETKFLWLQQKKTKS